MDIPRLKGVAYLEPHAIYPEDLEAWEEGRSEGGKRRCHFHPHGPLGAAGGQGSVDGCAEIGRAACVLRKMAEAARYRHAGQRCRERRDALRRRRRGPARSIKLVLVAMGAPIFDNCDLELAGSEAASGSGGNS